MDWEVYVQQEAHYVRGEESAIRHWETWPPVGDYLTWRSKPLHITEVGELFRIKGMESIAPIKEEFEFYLSRRPWFRRGQHPMGDQSYPWELSDEGFRWRHRFDLRTKRIGELKIGLRSIGSVCIVFGKFFRNPTVAAIIGALFTAIFIKRMNSAPVSK
ncbi:MAG: hypothetical protein HY287_03035 [Planctomycetes bacterium]|nr:hypothetical protein [Planctomycetota bacterium]